MTQWVQKSLSLFEAAAKKKELKGVGGKGEQDKWKEKEKQEVEAKEEKGASTFVLKN